MDELIGIIKEKSESMLNEKVVSINQFENITNNTVYKIETETKPYIFKIYKNKSWPEDGKLMFVSKKLSEFEIPHAKIMAFCRDDSNFSNGYLIEKCLSGVIADKLTFSLDEEIDLYKKLAELVSRVHQVKLVNYGYIGCGIACSETFTEFIEDSYKYNINNLLRYQLFSDKELTVIKEKLISRLDRCNQIPPVLCHGDLSKKNIIMGTNNEIALIDWDDAQSLCWIADVARLTLWMKLNYDKDTARIFRDVFLENYTTVEDKSIFFDLEDTLYVWYGLDYLNFFVGTPQYEKTMILFQESLNKILNTKIIR